MVTAALMALTLAPTAASAEGGFDSSLSGVLSGYRSRTWTDRNLDAANTTTNISGCSRDDGARFFLELDLRRIRSLAPDVHYGRRDVSTCTTASPTANWGRVQAGDYQNEFHHYNFGRVSARSVRVRY